MKNQNPENIFNEEEFETLKNFAKKALEEDRRIHGIINPPNQQQQFNQSNSIKNSNNSIQNKINQFSNQNVSKNIDKTKIVEPKTQENINQTVFHQTNIPNNPNQPKNCDIYVNNNNKQEYFNENIKQKVEKEEQELLSSFNTVISNMNNDTLIRE